MKPTNLERARAYLARMPVSIQGQGGSDAAIRAAIAMVKGLCLSEDVALALMNEDWNQRCQPQWSEAALRHKLRDAAKTNVPDGYLLEKDDGWQPHQRHAQQPAQSRETEQERKARLRAGWPEFKPLRRAGIEAIAKLRGLDTDPVDLAHLHGLLKGAVVDGHKCFVIHEGTFAQARRLDAQPLKDGEGKPIKTKNLAGSEGAFIGKSWLTVEKHVLLVEGVIGLLEGLAALWPSYCETPEAWAVIAATSASSRFARDPELLRSLASRHVRIVPDNDPGGAGFRAASIWLTELEAAGATVDAFELPPGVKDIGELLAAPELHAQTLKSLFQ